MRFCILVRLCVLMRLCAFMRCALMRLCVLCAFACLFVRSCAFACSHAVLRSRRTFLCPHRAYSRTTRFRIISALFAGIYAHILILPPGVGDCSHKRRQPTDERGLFERTLFVDAKVRQRLCRAATKPPPQLCDEFVKRAHMARVLLFFTFPRPLMNHTATGAAGER